jgi:hypothetical protein
VQSLVKRACQDLLAKLTKLSAGSPDQPLLAGLILVCKYLERISSHASTSPNRPPSLPDPSFLSASMLSANLLQ